jgi:hypothetical protein
MLHKLSGYKDRSLDVKAGKAMSEGTDVFMGCKVADQLIILCLELRWPPRIVFHLTGLTKANPCSVSYRQVITHVVYVCCSNHFSSFGFSQFITDCYDQIDQSLCGLLCRLACEPL